MSRRADWKQHNPVKIVKADLDTLPSYIQGKKWLLVTTPGFVTRGVVERLKRILSPTNIVLYDEVKSNPDLCDLDTAVAALKNCQIDGVMGLGGGSALDVAKVLSVLLAERSDHLTLVNIFRHKESVRFEFRLPLVLIPATSGTGSEVTPFATVWDHQYHQKFSLEGDVVFPDVAFLDPVLSLTLNRENTLYPALDTLSHALESLWNKNCTPVSRSFAFESLRLSLRSLPKVLEDLSDIFCRQDLQVASLLSGLAISQTRTAIAHALSYPLTLKFAVPHGLACSFTLPFFLDLYFSNESLCESEKTTLSNIKAMLLDLGLVTELERYANKEQLVECVTQTLVAPGSSVRANNYTFIEQFDVRLLVDFITGE